MGDIIVSLNDIQFNYNIASNNSLEVIKDVSMYCKENEIITILGPSGCGKSTLLNIISGIDNNYTGIKKLMEFDKSNYGCNIGVLFQQPVLFEWLTVRENIAYGLKIRKVKNSDELIEQYIECVGLKGFENYYPNELSGGMQQRVALARILILKPHLLLMDEPFAALDSQLRRRMQQLILKLWHKDKQAIVFVTHDIEEAIIVSNRIYILSARPSRVIEEIEVPFKDKQDMTFVDTYEFMQLKKRIKNILNSSCVENDVALV